MDKTSTMIQRKTLYQKRDEDRVEFYNAALNFIYVMVERGEITLPKGEYGEPIQPIEWHSRELLEAAMKLMIKD